MRLLVETVKPPLWNLWECGGLTPLWNLWNRVQTREVGSTSETTGRDGFATYGLGLALCPLFIILCPIILPLLSFFRGHLRL